ncbi:unnamed protein product [Penicillium roqueforti FM164]|uniref:Uncharacterized protein n=1 Tax=Penicillium roqueforti (strain FM164) TaxID=1365484 RepID=W6QM81_PENRF|nr:unnamed protein product [Penicillium roqueforti FM164]
MPDDTLFVPTIIHPTRASEHATAAITRNTRDGEAEAGTTAGKSSDEKTDGCNQRVRLQHPAPTIGGPSTKVYLFPCGLKQNSCRLLKYRADSRRARAAARGKESNIPIGASWPSRIPENSSTRCGRGRKFIT